MRIIYVLTSIRELSLMTLVIKITLAYSHSLFRRYQLHKRKI